MRSHDRDRQDRELKFVGIRTKGALYAIEKEIRGRPPEERREIRQARSKPQLACLRRWFEMTLPKLSRKSDTTVAICYGLSRRGCAAALHERWSVGDRKHRRRACLAGGALGRKNYLFADQIPSASARRRFTA